MNKAKQKATPTQASINPQFDKEGLTNLLKISRITRYHLNGIAVQLPRLSDSEDDKDVRAVLHEALSEVTDILCSANGEIEEILEGALGLSIIFWNDDDPEEYYRDYKKEIA